MNVYLYDNHHMLPFWGENRTAAERFDPDKMAGRVISHQDVKAVAENTFLWPVLLGLHQSPLPFLAHVSAFRKITSADYFGWPHRIWVQITTLPLPKAAAVS